MKDFAPHPGRILSRVTTPEDRRKISIEVNALTVNVSIADMMLVALIQRYSRELEAAAMEEGLYRREVKYDIQHMSASINTANAQLRAFERKSFPIAKYLRQHRDEYDAFGAYTAMIQVEGSKIYGKDLLILESVCKNAANKFVPQCRKTVAYAMLIHALSTSGKEVYDSYKERCEQLLQGRVTVDMSFLRHYNTAQYSANDICEILQDVDRERWNNMMASLAKTARPALRNFHLRLTDIWLSDISMTLYEEHERDYIRWYCAMAVIDCYQQGQVPRKTKDEVKAHIGEDGMAQFCAECRRMGEIASVIDDPNDLWDEIASQKHKYMDKLINYYTNYQPQN